MPYDGDPREYETTADDLTEVQQVLLRAADIIEQRGFAQATRTHNAYGSHCIVTAIAEAGRQSEPRRQAARNVFCAFVGLERDNLSRIFAWNDAPERTAAEVISALRAAAVGQGR